MKLIYLCVFHKQSYIQLLKLFSLSLIKKGNINKETTDILIVTSPDFQPLIQKELSEFDFPFKYFILNFHSLFEAGCARLHIFEYESIANYDKILYLDTDILINNDINIVLNLDISNDKIYALEEGNIGTDYHGGPTFFNLLKYGNPLPTAFTTGILYFYNSNTIQKLFGDILTHIHTHVTIQKNPIPDCLDQPFIVFNAFTQKKYDNQLLKLYVENNPSILSSKVIYHFPGGPGNYEYKSQKMIYWWNIIKLDLEDNINIHQDIWTCSDEMRYDVINFFEDKSDYKIAEIGSHKGYTTRVLSKIFSHVYAVDNSIEWTDFNKNYNKDRTNVTYVNLDIYKESWSVLPEDIDVCFIDANHQYQTCRSDIVNSLKQFKNLKYIIFDDYGVWPGVYKAVQEFLQSGKLRFQRFIGIRDVPGPNGIVRNTREGIICSVDRFGKPQTIRRWFKNL